MRKFHTLAKIVRTLLKAPYALQRGLPDEEDKAPPAHDAIYGNEYFQFVEQTTIQSADAIADSIVRSFQPALLVDVGCGTGVLLECLRRRGVRGKGLEYAEAALALCRLRKLEVIKFDVTTDPLPVDFGHADVVISMEVGQQLPATSADRYVDLLCQSAPVVIFSSGVPGQGDRHPLNEQPHQYWIAKFHQRGYCFDEALSLQWRKEWKVRATAPWFHNNVLVFRSRLPNSEQ